MAHVRAAPIELDQTYLPAATRRRVVAYLVDLVLVGIMYLGAWEVVDRMGIALPIGRVAAGEPG